MSTYPAFRDLKFSLMAIMFSVRDLLKLSELFYALPHWPVPWTKKDPLPPVGTIISLRYAGEVRGFYTPKRKPKAGEKPKHMKNCIILDLVTPSKLVSVKIFSNYIHICGVKSYEMAQEAIDILGPLLSPNGKLEITRDFITMINYNHRVPFGIRKKELVRLLCQQGYFVVKYDNAAAKGINVKRSYDYQVDGELKTSKHTFVVHSNGGRTSHITQAGKSLDEMEEMYNKFFADLYQHRAEIELLT